MIKWLYRRIGPRDMLVFSLTPDELYRLAQGQTVLTPLDELPRFAGVDFAVMCGGSPQEVYESGEGGFLVTTGSNEDTEKGPPTD